MILLIDNYDSFVHNLARYVGELGYERAVVRNDRITIPEVEAMRPSHVILSPGPRAPADAGISSALVEHLGGRIPILGVCLGHLCIGVAYGGRVVRSRVPMHGKTSLVEHDGRGVFRELPNPLPAARYHSLALEAATMPDALEVTARTADGEVMAVRHRDHPVVGVQFHPESVLTTAGHALLRNFLTHRIGV